MNEEVYEKLQEFLNQFPLGFPKTPSGIEIKILKKLFTDNEAELVPLLTHIPETVARITRQHNLE